MRQKHFKTLRFIVASSLGTYLEFLDYTMFAFASKIIAEKLLPPSEWALTYTWMIFALSFLFRIFGTVFFGTVFFGTLGDRFGCKKALLLSMALMAISTSAIGLIPNYEYGGLWSPVLLLLFRSVQSFAVSPEYSGVSTYLKNNQILTRYYSFVCSFTVAVAGFGMLTGGFWMAKMLEGYTVSSIPELSWRLPFILSGLLVGTAGLFLRISMINEVCPEVKTSPVMELFTEEKSTTVKLILMVGLIGVMTYTMSGYLPNFLHQSRDLSLDQALSFSTKNTMVLCLAVLFSGYLADRYSAPRILSLAVWMILISILPIFSMLINGGLFQIKLAMTSYAFLLGFFSGPMPGYLAQNFRQSHRFTGSSVGYNIGMSVFGGMTPLSMVFVAKYSFYAPGLIIVSFGLLVLWLLRPLGKQLKA